MEGRQGERSAHATGNAREAQRGNDKRKRREDSREHGELVAQGLGRVQPSTLGHAETHTWPCCGHWYGRRTILSRYKFAGEDIRRWEVREPLGEHGGEEYTRQGEPVRRRWGDS